MSAKAAVTDAALTALLKAPRRIAVLGYSANNTRASNHVTSYMASNGHRMVGVNPAATSAAAGPVTVVPTLAAAYETFAVTTDRTGSGDADAPAIEIVDVFRKPDALPGIVAEVLQLPTKPRLVFLQEGVTHAESEAALAAAGIDVISNRCLLKEHQRLVGLGSGL
jgi:predicted CoA-binding protein